MKILHFILTLFFAIGINFSAWSQTLTITGPSTVEVGIAGSYNAAFDKQGKSITIVSYTIEAPWIGNGLAGPSGIVGSLRSQTSSNPLKVDTTGITLTFPVIWGDYHNGETSDQVTVTVAYKENGANWTITNNKSVTISRICTPTFTGPLTIQSCCVTPVTYAVVACDANAFTWSISSGGGTITPGATSATIMVTPTVNTGFTLTCIARRSTGLTTYSRTSTITVGRTPPVTPAITAPSYYCTGEQDTICINSTICGMTGTTWNVPSSLQIISGQGTNCLIVTPANGIADGTTGTITAQAIMVGGCAAVNAPQKNFTIYTSENPPVPQGYITLELDGGGPCDNPVYIVVWHPTQLYLNGYTSVSPGIVLGGTHPHGGGGADRIKITVCNVNLCSGRKSCIEFWVDRPYPCGDMGLTTPTLVYTDAFPSDTNDRSEAGPVGDAEEITIYPNPSTGNF